MAWRSEKRRVRLGQTLGPLHLRWPRLRTLPMRVLLNWLLSAVALWVVSQIVPGFQISGLGSALIAVVVIGLVNATLGILLKVLTFPLTVVTLGVFWWVINALMLWVASSFVPGFAITSFGSAFVGAIVLALVNMLFHWALRRRDLLASR
jgi:putative membrane protein